MNRKFVPCIYLYQKQAVRSLTDLTVIASDPVKLAAYYNENNADEIIVFDMSALAGEVIKSERIPEVKELDALHDEALDIIKEICAVSEVDVIGAGNVKRMEDIKKILYTGCKKAVLDYNIPGNIRITKEVSQKFGKEKIVVSYSSINVLEENRELISDYVGTLLCMDPHKLRESAEIFQMPVYVQINQVALNKFLELLALPCMSGITGNMINDNVREILAMKDLCTENGIPVERLVPLIPWSELKTNSDGLIPVIIQDDKTNEVLMMAYMNEEAYLNTFKTGKMTYFSRSRQSLWLKGETSGHYQYVKSITADCDKDTLLAKVSQVGVACHTGARSCFFQEIVSRQREENANPLKVFEEVFDVIKDRKIHPKEGSYTNYLFDKGIDKILKKLGEEATEIVIAAKNPGANEVKYEISDFLYHMMVLMAEKEITWEEITTELANR